MNAQCKLTKLWIGIYARCTCNNHKRSVREIIGYFVSCNDNLACLFPTDLSQQNLDDSVLQEGLATMLGAPESTTCDYVQEDSPPFPLLRLEEEDDEDKEPFVDTWLPHTSCVSEAIPTPPPDSSPRFASTEESASLTHCESFVKGSSLDETPASSPGCNSESEDCTVKVKVEYTSEEDQSNRLSLKRSRSGSEEDSSEEEELPLPKNLKLPQSKLSSGKNSYARIIIIIYYRMRNIIISKLIVD